MAILSPNPAVVEGWIEPAFAACLDAFRANFAPDGELGAACAVYRHGKPVLSLWGGVADAASGAPWRGDTAVPVFSVTKGVAALCVLMLVDRGLIDLDQRVAHYWPEFGAAGKDRVTVRQALAHRAGVPLLTGPVTAAEFADPVAMAARVAAEAPLFPPDTTHAYHAFTVGWITGELVRRVTGSTLGAWFRVEVARPRGLNIAIGRAADDHGPVAVFDVPADRDLAPIPEDHVIARPIGLNGFIKPSIAGLAGLLNDPATQRIEQAGANAVADAPSLAKLFAATLSPIGGERLLSDETIRDASRILSAGVQWTGFPGPTFGAGFMLPGGTQPMLGEGSFGHDGLGGSLAFAHPASGIAFAYVRNRPGKLTLSADPLVYRMVGAVAAAAGIGP